MFCKSKVAPDATVVVPSVVPSALLAVTASVPALTEVEPVKVLFPDNVQVPASCLVSVPATVPKILASVPPCAQPNVNP